jgi:hypothetical protein
MKISAPAADPPRLLTDWADGADVADVADGGGQVAPGAAAEGAPVRLTVAALHAHVKRAERARMPAPPPAGPAGPSRGRRAGAPGAGRNGALPPHCAADYC